MEKVFLPGSTLILQLKLEGFARYLGDNFDDLIHSVGNGTLKLPTNTGERVEGKFALKTNEDLFLQETYEISAWESTVNEIYERGSIEKEIHFVIVGIFEENPGEIKSLIEWRDYINVNNEYKILVYIFSPSANTIDMSDYCLHLSSSVEVESKNPRDLLVNAPHDLKNWSIRVPPQSLLGTGYEWLGTREGWIQVGPKTVEDENQLDNSSPFVWEVDLTLNHGRGWPAFCVAFLLLGIIFATPVFLATWKPGKMSDTESFIAAGYALLFGAFAASGILYLPLFPSLSEWVRKQL